MDVVAAESVPATRKPSASKTSGWRLSLATSLAGVYGTITLAGILTLPLVLSDGSPFPARGLASFLAAAVILLLLVGASTGRPRLSKGLDVPRGPTELREEDHARAAAARAAIESINRAPGEIQQKAPPAETDLYANVAGRLIAIHQCRLREDGPD